MTFLKLACKIQCICACVCVWGWRGCSACVSAYICVFVLCAIYIADTPCREIRPVRKSLRSADKLSLRRSLRWKYTPVNLLLLID